jgi:hypothetical protein
VTGTAFGGRAFLLKAGRGQLMARRMREEKAWDDDADEDGDGDDTIPCPYCRRLIHEAAQRCPYCENYLSEEDAPAARKPWWIVVGALLCFLVLYLWIKGG